LYLIIPARAGSKRIIHKNFRNFLGKPIISYAIETAIKSGLFKEIIVSTDSEEIMEIAKKYSVAFEKRSSSLSDDYTNTDEVVADFIKRNQISFDEVICCVYPTTPFLEIEDLQASYAKFSENPGEFLMAVTQVGFPIERTFRLNEKGLLVMSNPENYSTRSQDLPSRYRDAGQFYWGTSRKWLEVMTSGVEEASYFELPWLKSIDIDTVEDWERAEKLFVLK